MKKINLDKILLLFLNLTFHVNYAQIVDLTLIETSGANQNDVFITFGQIFKRGDVNLSSELGAQLNGTALDIQINEKARHNDGSLRHAVITVKIPELIGSQTNTLSLNTTGQTISGNPVNLQNLVDNNFDARVEIKENNTTYSISVVKLLNEGNLITWLEGPLMSEWILNGSPEDENGVPHSHLFVQFCVRGFSGSSKARVDFTIENTWSYVANPHNITYDVDLYIENQIVYSKANLLHYRQARWRKIFWWGATPKYQLKHNTEYLIETGAIPSYDLSIEIPSGTLEEMETSWSGNKIEPMGIGVTGAYMPTTGAAPGIGPFPRWAVRYLLSMDKRAEITTLGMGDLAGSWSCHYRDINTKLPISLDDHPEMTILASGYSFDDFPDCSGDCSTPYTHDSSHQPSFAYLPYLLSGDYYYLEELHFWANYNMLQAHPEYRDFEKGLLIWDQVRGQAWSLRTLGQAAYITPDNHPLKDYFVKRVGYNLDFYNKEFSYNQNANGLGVNASSQVFQKTQGLGFSAWLDDFFTWSVGYLVNLNFESAIPLRKWKSKFSVSRMTDSVFCWIHATHYEMIIGKTDGSLFNSISECYEPTLIHNGNEGVLGLSCNGIEMQSQLGLEVGEMVGYADSPTGYPSNLQIALAVAVESGISNSNLAWEIFINRKIKPNYSEEPQFAIVPYFVENGGTTNYPDSPENVKIKK